MKQIYVALLALVCLAFVAKPKDNVDKIGGIHLCASFDKEDLTQNPMLSMEKDAGADWVSIVPYATGTIDEPDIIYDTPHQWYGEKPEGIIHSIEQARAAGLKIMLKPQVWLPNGWVGDYQPETEAAWEAWQCSYDSYILPLVDLAQEHKVELFCIGTEYKIAARERPKYWEDLIDQIRSKYDGKLTYASNWDNYYNITFWGKLDYIGIDSYFPLIPNQTPEKDDLLAAWKKGPEKALYRHHLQYQRPILFTEYGYLNVDSTAWKHWINEKNYKRLGTNPTGQANALDAFYSTFWKKDWVAGGFLWRWYADYGDPNARWHEKDYTPQGKPSMKVVNQWYEAF